jgi:hypothetical protein
MGSHFKSLFYTRKNKAEQRSNLAKKINVTWRITTAKCRSEARFWRGRLPGDQELAEAAWLGCLTENITSDVLSPLYLLYLKNSPCTNSYGLGAKQYIQNSGGDFVPPGDHQKKYIQYQCEYMIISAEQLH